MTTADSSSSPGLRRIRVCYFNTWADDLEPCAAYLRRLPNLDLRPRVARAEPDLLRKARLDCDWYGENARCFASLRHEGWEFLSAYVCGPRSVLAFAALPREGVEDRWLIVMGHQPQALGPLAGKTFAYLRTAGVRILYYAFDEASRFMPCFREIAPHLDLLIHDEQPLDQVGAALIRTDCVRIHRSWVANLSPFAVPFTEAPAKKILFLGSKLGLTENRKKQITYLTQRFRDQFVPLYDHSVGVSDRRALGRFKVALCPEGRKFTTAAMSRTHTDRPFWSGCVGMVPLSENSAAGDRLEELAAARLILRYPHGDLKALGECCEHALALGDDDRRRIYEHFNRRETIGTVVTEALAATAVLTPPLPLAVSR